MVAEIAKRLSFSWDKVGQRNLMLDLSGGRTSYVHDEAGQLTMLVNPQQERTSYTYDLVGQRLTQTLGNGASTTFIYDAASRTTRVAHPSGLDGYAMIIKGQTSVIVRGDRSAKADIVNGFVGTISPDDPSGNTIYRIVADPVTGTRAAYCMQFDVIVEDVQQDLVSISWDDQFLNWGTRCRIRGLVLESRQTLLYEMETARC